MKERDKVTYRISIREPHWEKWTMLWDIFEIQKDAEDFIKEISSTYPEGTLLFITGVWPYTSKGQHPYFTRKAFIVDEYGEAKPMPRKWITEKEVPAGWVKGIEITIPEAPQEVLPPWSGLETTKESPEEIRGIQRLIGKLDPESLKVYNTYLDDMEKYYSKIERLKRISEGPQVRVSDLPKDWYRKI